MRDLLFHRRMLAAVVLMTLTAPAVPSAHSQEADTKVTVEHVLAWHLEARGGGEVWEKARSLRIEGQWSAFSEHVPMTILRMRPNLYRFDYELFGTPAVLAYDGQKPWLKSPMFGAPEGREITEEWKRNVLEDIPFGSPLLAHAAAGVPIDLVGRAEVEGQPTWALAVRPPDSPVETWYLDAETFLEVKRTSRTFDVFSGPGQEIEMHSFFMDFRDVGGLILPFREERHFGTRYHVFEAASIEVNPELDAAVFRIPESKPGS